MPFKNQVALSSQETDINFEFTNHPVTHRHSLDFGVVLKEPLAGLIFDKKTAPITRISASPSISFWRSRKGKMIITFWVLLFSLAIAGIATGVIVGQRVRTNKMKDAESGETDNVQDLTGLLSSTSSAVTMPSSSLNGVTEIPNIGK